MCKYTSIQHILAKEKRSAGAVRMRMVHTHTHTHTSCLRRTGALVQRTCLGMARPVFIHTVYDLIFGDFPAKTNVYTPYMRGSGQPYTRPTFAARVLNRHANAHTHTHTHTHTHARTHARTHALVRTHARTHAHTHTQPKCCEGTGALI